ncbi:hypothetical protein, partial [Staphylococcus aureus]|uniref:hypothetical protein n=1 Tax=Staphylococcus aureus TaxID=1280 RepID=UPI0038B3E8FD
MELQEDEAPHRLRRSAFLPLFSPIVKRAPVGNDLEALADIVLRERERKAREDFRNMLKEMG